jgi:ribosomal protein S18 acetylase RimI-like enzyme
MLKSDLPARIRHAHRNDGGEWMMLRRGAYVAEAQRLRNPFIAPLQETVEQVTKDLADPDAVALLAVLAQDCDAGRRGRFVGSIRVRVEGTVADIGRVVVACDVRGHGIGSALLEAAHHEAISRPQVTSCEIVVMGAAQTDLALYRRHGYAESRPRLGPDGESVPVLSMPLTRD